MPDSPTAGDAVSLVGSATIVHHSRPRDFVHAFPAWEKVSVALMVILAIFLDCFRLSSDIFGNLYYAAAVKSMLMTWHNFFFASFDPRSFVTVDKPPVGLWVQVASAKVFGFSPISLILPQAIAGVLSVVVLYALVRRTFGGPAGLLAGVLLAVSPINVVSNRDNIMESLLVLTTLLSAWAVLKAAETGEMKWLAVGGALIGIGFNIKMLEAYLVIPACMLAYVVASPGSLRLRLRHVIYMVVILAVVSLAWIAAVDATPIPSRPYVDSTLTNSELDLAFNYNGLQRLLGQPAYGHRPKPPSPGTGNPGPLRLFQPELGAQISWFLPLALAGLFTSIWELRLFVPNARRKWRWRSFTPKQSEFTLWVVWLLTAAVFFSMGRFFNRYYLVMLAPALCALAGIGIVGLWQDFMRKGPRRWLLPAAVLATGTEQGIILSGYRYWNSWLLPAVLLAACLGVAFLLALKIPWRARALWLAIPFGWRLHAIVPGVALAVLVVAPLFWLVASFSPGNEGGFPVSGPTVGDSTGSGTQAIDPKLIAFLEAHAGSASYLAATNTAGDAAPIILATGAPVLAMGGFSGYDPILTPTSLIGLVTSGKVRFFVLPSTNLSVAQETALYPESLTSSTPAESFTSSYTNRLTQWVGRNCLAVPPQQWKTTVELGPTQLFDCDGRTPS